MSLFDSMNALSQLNPEQGFQSMSEYTPTYTEPAMKLAPTGWEEEFQNLRLYPTLYNLDGYTQPLPYVNWGNGFPIGEMAEDMRNALEPQRLDINKIFTSEIQALRKVGSDQYRIIKMFEKKFTEMITEKGKFGITEEDVEAFNALISARAQLTANTKEQVAIKKSIAELKIKQNQAMKQVGGMGGPAGASPMDASSDSIGRSILDNIFSVDTNNTPAQTAPTDFASLNPTDAASILDSLIPSSDVSEHIQFEASQPKTFVVVGRDGSDPEYQTFSGDGTIIPDYPNPTSKITDIDKDTGKATDELLVQYDLKFRD